MATFNPPPGWPQLPPGWTPPAGWQPDPSWPAAPEGWQWWTEEPAAAPAQVAPQPLPGQPAQGFPQPFEAPGQANAGAGPSAMAPAPRARKGLGAGAIIAIVAAAALVLGIIAVGANLLLGGRMPGGNPPSTDSQTAETAVTYGPQIAADGSGEITDVGGNAIGTLSILSVAAGPPRSSAGTCTADQGNTLFTVELQLTALDSAVEFNPFSLMMVSDDGTATVDGSETTVKCLDVTQMLPMAIEAGDTATGLVVIMASSDWHLLQYGDIFMQLNPDDPGRFWWDLNDFELQPAPDPNEGLELQPRGPGEVAELRSETGEPLAELAVLSATDSFAFDPQMELPECTPPSGYVNYTLEIQVTAVAEWGDFYIDEGSFWSRNPGSETFNDNAYVGNFYCLAPDQFVPLSMDVGETAIGYLVFQVPIGSTEIVYNPNLVVGGTPVENNYYVWDLTQFM